MESWASEKQAREMLVDGLIKVNGGVEHLKVINEGMAIVRLED